MPPHAAQQGALPATYAQAFGRPVPVRMAYVRMPRPGGCGLGAGAGTASAVSLDFSAVNRLTYGYNLNRRVRPYEMFMSQSREQHAQILAATECAIVLSIAAIHRMRRVAATSRALIEASAEILEHSRAVMVGRESRVGGWYKHPIWGPLSRSGAPSPWEAYLTTIGVPRRRP